MIYRVRTTSGRDYLTQGTDPAEAMTSKSDWRTVTFVTLDSGRDVILRGSCLESVELIPDDQVQRQ